MKIPLNSEIRALEARSLAGPFAVRYRPHVLEGPVRPLVRDVPSIVEMLPPRLILAPVDFSDCGRVALTFAGRLAQHCNAGLHVLHAESRLLEAAARSRDIDLVAQTRAELQRFAESTYPAANGSPLYYVVSDPPAAAICEAAVRHGADLIVMGPHGRSRLERAVLGSTTEAVLLRATTDILVVPPSWTPPVAERSGLEGIGPVVVGIRDLATAGPSLEAAETLASTLNSYVEVVHVVPDVQSEARADSVLTLHGDPGRALLDHLATPGRQRSVLLVDRTHRRGRTELGRTTRTLLTHCQVPMFWRA